MFLNTITGTELFVRIAPIVTYTTEDEKTLNYIALAKAITDKLAISPCISYHEATNLYISFYNQPIIKFVYMLDNYTPLDKEILLTYITKMYNLRCSVAFSNTRDITLPTFNSGVGLLFNFSEYFSVVERDVICSNYGIINNKILRITQIFNSTCGHHITETSTASAGSV